MLESLKAHARAIRRETHALYYAYRDRRTPWLAKAVALLVLIYAFSPIDLIPDFVPVLGYLDDLIIVPAGIALAIRLIPAGVMAEARLTASQAYGRPRELGYAGAAIVVILWLAAAVWIIHMVLAHWI